MMLNSSVTNSQVKHVPLAVEAICDNGC